MSKAALKAKLAKIKEEENRAKKEEEERKKREEEEERLRQEEEAKRKEEERLKAEEDAKRRQRIQTGKEMSDSQKSRKEQDLKKIKDLIAAGGGSVAGLMQNGSPTTPPVAALPVKIHDTKSKEEQERREEAVRKRLEEMQKECVRAPIICVLGHVDVGKTKLLDKIRQTNVQLGEAGGITQQIGASFFPIKTIFDKCQEVTTEEDIEYNIPGILIIDTPGHESFTNLRSRGSSLCDIAILVVDLMHGLEPQTKEAIQLLKQKKTPFVVAVNKIDRLYGWVSKKDGCSRKSIDAQEQHVKQEFDTRVRKVISELELEGLNSCLYWKNEDYRKYVSLVPTSAHTGEGIPDLLYLMTKLTQQFLAGRITKHEAFQATVLEVKVIEGLGYTIDVILVNGVLREGDTILLGGTNGPIRTAIRALLTPQPLKEMRVKGEYLHHKEIPAAQGIKICANDLEHAIAGSQLFVVRDDMSEEEIQKMTNEVKVDNILAAFDLKDKGVYVQASTLGSLEALIVFLTKECDPPVPVAHVGIGPLHKKDVVKASVMVSKAKEFAVILAFDVQITKEAQEIADKEGVTVFSAEIIYHLFDKFKAFRKEYLERIKKEAEEIAIFPVQMKIVKCFRAKDPFVLGCEIIEGSLRAGTPLFTENEKGEIVKVGRVQSIENDKKTVEILKQGQQGAVCITPAGNLTYGRQVDETSILYSEMNRDAIDALKSQFRDQVSKAEWKLILDIKKKLRIL